MLSFSVEVEEMSQFILSGEIHSPHVTLSIQELDHSFVTSEKK